MSWAKIKINKAVPPETTGRNTGSAQTENRQTTNKKKPQMTKEDIWENIKMKIVSYAPVMITLVYLPIVDVKGKAGILCSGSKIYISDEFWSLPLSDILYMTLREFTQVLLGFRLEKNINISDKVKDKHIVKTEVEMMFIVVQNMLTDTLLLYSPEDAGIDRYLIKPSRELLNNIHQSFGVFTDCKDCYIKYSENTEALELFLRSWSEKTLNSVVNQIVTGYNYCSKKKTGPYTDINFKIHPGGSRFAYYDNLSERTYTSYISRGEFLINISAKLAEQIDLQLRSMGESNLKNKLNGPGGNGQGSQQQNSEQTEKEETGENKEAKEEDSKTDLLNRQISDIKRKADKGNGFGPEKGRTEKAGAGNEFRNYLVNTGGNNNQTQDNFSGEGSSENKQSKTGRDGSVENERKEDGKEGSPENEQKRESKEGGSENEKKDGEETGAESEQKSGEENGSENEQNENNCKYASDFLPLLKKEQSNVDKNVYKNILSEAKRCLDESPIAYGKNSFGKRAVEIYNELYKISSVWWKKAKSMIMGYVPDVNSSYRRPNKKFATTEFILPSQCEKSQDFEVDRLRVFLDSSGSMTDEDFKIFKSLIKGAQSNFPQDTLAYEFNTVVTPMKCVRGKIVGLPAHSGGTDISCVTNFINSQPDKGKTLNIVVTDGGFDWRQLVSYMKNKDKISKFMFILTTSNRDYILAKKQINKKRLNVVLVKDYADF
ncbi:MAG: hypothetical protein LUD81_11395 [Clostridiales bacterium]|nr:hypothetical protein [Clostridiales bacterium]